MAQPNNRLKGKVMWFDYAKGFGFIKHDRGCKNIFVHRTSIKSGGHRYLIKNEIVEFEVAQDKDDRIKAVNVTRSNRSGIQESKSSPNNGGFGLYQEVTIPRRYVFVYGYNGGRRACYNCGIIGHMAKDCYKHSFGGINVINASSGGDVGGRYRGGSRSCYNCGEAGHYAKECPNN